ncbi:MAG TPA: toxin-antitoxin system HicB family antitoxin [Vicinamibacterales bacterium]|nr:toxin-antitoxin system HicB family antitoxin [Vicinamibacterales bacterium]
MSVRLPESLHKQARELAEREGVSINQLVATALAEKVSALMTVEYLEERAGRGSVAAFRKALSKVPAAEPVEGDEL